MTKDEMAAKNLREVLQSILLGDSEVIQQSNGPVLAVYLKEGAVNFLKEYIHKHNLNISLKTDLPKTNYYEVQGEGVQEFLISYLDVHCIIERQDINLDVILMWVCLFTHYNDESFIINAHKLNEKTVHNFLRNYILHVEDARIARINDTYYIDNLEDLFKLTVREKFPSIHSIRISKIMIEKENSTDNYLNTLDIFKKILKGERKKYVYNY